MLAARSRRLLTYRRIPDVEVDTSVTWTKRTKEQGSHADELNSFRRKYFQGFKDPEAEAASTSAATTPETTVATAKQGPDALPQQLSDLSIQDTGSAKPGDEPK
ncbi:RNA methylase family protein [Neofusicoccum parvum]|uniref:RNA methylase family protein n=1 Tax=Neofusicoccum parvum TaxID=310453 RepID=A0ACB5RSP0_9PEZI|nr:RNA methylase family protein [Neofusicoccum parvum]